MLSQIGEGLIVAAAGVRRRFSVEHQASDRRKRIGRRVWDWRCAWTAFQSTGGKRGASGTAMSKRVRWRPPVPLCVG